MHETHAQPVDGDRTYGEFSDPRLVAIYDTVCPIVEYEPFYLELAEQLSAATIIDIGCGTGLLTHELARRGHRVIGVEPAPAMLEIARRRLHGQDVRWINGSVEEVGEENADLAIMTGHVAQFFLDESSWAAALASIHRALKPGGILAFESRNPLVQPWANRDVEPHGGWLSSTRHRTITDPKAGPIEWWTDGSEVTGNLLRYEIHYVFERSGEHIVSENALVFRSEAEIRESLVQAGFTIEHVYGDWDRRPAGPDTREMIFVAERA